MQTHYRLSEITAEVWVDGTTVVARVGPSIGVARCHPTDIFNEDVGGQLALGRALENEARALKSEANRALRKARPKKQKAPKFEKGSLEHFIKVFESMGGRPGMGGDNLENKAAQALGFDHWAQFVTHLSESVPGDERRYYDYMDSGVPLNG